MPSRSQRHRLETFRADILNEALAICDGRTAGELDDARILHLRGVLALQRGDQDHGIACLRRAIAIAPSQPLLHHDLGDALLDRGDAEGGLAAHLRAVILDPDEAERYRRLGRGLHQQRQYVESQAAYVEALRLRPRDAAIRRELGDVLLDWDHIDQALAAYTASHAGHPSPESHARLGRAFLKRRNWPHALEHFQQGLTLDDDAVDLLVGAGEAWRGMGRFDEAERAFHAAVTRHPAHVASARHYALVLELLGRRGDAVGAWVGLGRALEKTGRRAEAITAYKQGLASKPDCLRALTALGQLHMARGDSAAAVECLQRAVSVDAHRAQSHVDLGLALHAAGHIDPAWEELAWSHGLRADWHGYDQPAWDGSPLKGRTILLWSDPSAPLADTVQFVRYANFVRTSGGRVLVQCDRSLIPLVGHMSSVHHVLRRGQPIPAYDVHAPLQYFPACVRAARGDLQADQPYLAVSADLQRTWCEKLGRVTRPRIGLSWASEPDDSRASSSWRTDLHTFAPLLAEHRIQMVSLQRGDHRHETFALRPDQRIDEILDVSSSLADVAAVIANLDAVVTVDALLAQLAGAMGKPVWVLVPPSACWPWPAEGGTVPWYPTIRLMRRHTLAHELTHAKCLVRLLASHAAGDVATVAEMTSRFSTRLVGPDLDA